MRLVEFTQDLAKQYALWKYPSPYDVYNLPDWETICKNNYSISTPDGRKNFLCYKKDDELLGIVNFKEKQDYIYLGIGINPNMCGKGMGKMVLETAINDYEKQNNRIKPYYAEVREWNDRSIKTLQHVGFKIIGSKLCKGKNDEFEAVVLIKY